MTSSAPSPADHPPTVTPLQRPLRFPRNLVSLISNNLRIVPEAAYHDEVVELPGPPKLVILVGPEHLKRVLQHSWDDYPRARLKNEFLRPLFGQSMGQCEREEWRWQRQAATPLFKRSELAGYVPQMHAAAAEMVSRWHGAASPIRDVERDMLHAAFRVVSTTLLSGAPDELLDEIERGHDDYLAGANWWIAYTMLGLPHWLPRPGGKAMRSHERQFRAGVRRLVEERRPTAADGDDMMARWIRASDPETGRTMTNDRLTDNIVGFLVSGYLTIGQTMTWTLYLLARYPEWADRLADEVTAVVGDGPVTTDHVDRLVQVRQVLQETMRLYPTSPVLVRDALTDATFGGVEVTEGTTILIPVYALHRHRGLWERPDEFDPDRFHPDRDQPDRYHYMPFGAGPRVCIGAQFATVEATVLIAEFVRAARFELEPGLTPEPAGRTVLVPKNGMPLRVVPR